MFKIMNVSQCSSHNCACWWPYATPCCQDICLYNVEKSFIDFVHTQITLSTKGAFPGPEEYWLWHAFLAWSSAAAEITHHTQVSHIVCKQMRCNQWKNDAKYISGHNMINEKRVLAESFSSCLTQKNINIYFQIWYYWRSMWLLSFG